MSDEAKQLISLARSVLDGESVDWKSEEGSAERSGGVRRLRTVRSLRNVQRIIEAHRPLHSAERSPRELELTISVSGSALSGSDSRCDLVTEDPGPTWGPLCLLDRIGQGSFGEVFRAWDPQLDREVALKLLRADNTARDGSAVIEEGRLMARVRHPNVATVFGGERHDGRVGLWMEFVDGQNLADIIAARGPYGPREAAVVGLEVCRALAAVHQRSLLHRDVKANNVMREEGGRIVLMDFGAGREIGSPSKEASCLSGTPLYMAPEVLSGGSASVRSDIYGLGVLLYFLVTGAFPFEAESLAELEQRHKSGERTWLRDRRPDLPHSFVQAVERAIAPDPAQRFGTVGEMEAALRAAAGGTRASAGSARGFGTARSILLRSRPLRVALGVAALSIVVLGLWWARQVPESTLRGPDPAMEPDEQVRVQRKVDEPVRGELPDSNAGTAVVVPREAVRADDPGDVDHRQLREEQLADLDKLGGIRAANGDYQGALEAYRQMLDLLGETADPSKVARVRLDLGWTYHRLGDLSRARGAYEQVLAVQEAAIGKEHPEIAETLEKLGMVLRDADDPAAAEAPLRRALRLREAAFGERHRLVATSLGRLGALLEDLGRLDEAEELIERAAAVRADLLEVKDPAVRMEDLATQPLGRAPYTLETAMFRSSEGAVEQVRSGDGIAVGDAVHVKLVASTAIHVYVLSEDEEGQACLNFPVVGLEPSNPLAAGMRHRLPPRIRIAGGVIDGWQITSAGGREYLYLIASPAPLDEFESVLGRLSPNRSPVDLPCFAAEDEPIARLRGMSTLAVSPIGGSPRRLFEYARRLADGSETTSGVLIRRFELKNPQRP